MPNGNFQTIKLLSKELGYPFFKFEKSFTRKEEKDSWGVAIFSKFPIIESDTIRFSNQTLNSCLWADIQLDSSIIRLVNVHLQSIYLSDENYHYIGDVADYQDVQAGPTKEIARKVKRAFILRAQQAEKIHKEIQRSPYPVIICGDFNDSPVSFAYHLLSEDLQDAFLKSGNGIGATYAGPFKFYRIDYILASRHFDIQDYTTICKKFSDHYPIMASMSLSAE